MSRHKFTVTRQEQVFSDILKIEKASIQIDDGKDEFTRVRIKRPDAVAVFIYNTDREKIVMIRQFRYAIHDKTSEHVLEIMAGKIDGDDSPEETAIREAEEECGYRIKKGALKKITEFFASPGYTSEKFYLYYAEVTDADRVNDGGGLADEHEFIEQVELSKDEFQFLIKNGGINDAKTLVGGLWVISEGLVD